MTKALSGAPQIPFRRPDGVNLYPVHAEKGYQVKLSDPNVVMEVFKPGQSPSTSNFIDLPEDSVTKKTIVTPDLY